MSKEKLETGSMLNPKCKKCSKKDTCNNKTLCTYLIPKKQLAIEKNVKVETISSFGSFLYKKTINNK